MRGAKPLPGHVNEFCYGGLRNCQVRQAKLVTMEKIYRSLRLYRR